MFRFTITSHVFLALVTVLLVTMALSTVVEASSRSLPKDLEAVVERYFSTTKGYQRGDLITRSQLEDLQKYIRQTQGISLATHYKWRKQMLKDHAPLAKKFRAGGALVLRQVSTELGGYKELNRFSLQGSGRKKIQEAIDANSPDILLQALAAERTRIEALPDPERKRITLPSRRIYTVSDFMSALKPAESVPKIEIQPIPSPSKSSEVRVETLEKEGAKNNARKR